MLANDVMPGTSSFRETIKSVKGNRNVMKTTQALKDYLGFLCNTFAKTTQTHNFYLQVSAP